MKKILVVLLSVFMLTTLSACSKGYEEIPEQYVNGKYNGELEVFYGKYASDLFKALYIRSDIDDEEFLERAKIGSDKTFAMNQKEGITYKYKDYEVYKEYTNDEVKDYNRVYEKNDVEKFSKLVHLIVYYDEYKNDVLEKEHSEGMLIGKVKGEWKLIRFFTYWN